MNIFPAAFLLACIGLASFFTGIIAHEGTHLALANEPHGVCFGKCQTSASPLGWALATASGEHNQESRREDKPIAVGLGTTAITLTIGTKAFFQVAT